MVTPSIPNPQLFTRKTCKVEACNKKPESASAPEMDKALLDRSNLRTGLVISALVKANTD